MFIFKRKNIYYVEYFDEECNKQKRISTKQKTKAAALRFISELKQKLPARVKQQSISLSEFITEYEANAEQIYSAKYIKSIKLSFRMIKDFLGEAELSEVTPKRVEQFQAFTFRRAKHSAHLYHRTLKAAFNKAVQWNYIESNPFKEVSPPKIQKKIPVFIEKKELEEIMRQVKSESLRNLFEVGFNTGLRLSELISLQWSDVDLKRGEIVIGNTGEFITKGKSARTIPLNAQMRSKLSTLHSVSRCKYVFPNERLRPFNDDYVSRQFKYAVRDANLSEQIHFHTLRHSFASRLVQRGISLYIVKELLGHSDISTTQIYAHLDNGFLKAAVEVI